MIELGVLGLLRERQLHGYELQRRLCELLRSTVSFGSLYPALNRLEAAGLVEAVESFVRPARPAIPSTGSFAGEIAAFRASRRRTPRGPRNKKVYGLTGAGEARLAELLQGPEDEDRTFPLKLAFCHWAEPEARIALFERRRATLGRRLEVQRRSLSDGPLDRYLRALREHDVESTERDIAWLDQLITRERVAPDASPVEVAPPEGTAPRTGRTLVTSTPKWPGIDPGTTTGGTPTP